MIQPEPLQLIGRESLEQKEGFFEETFIKKKKEGKKFNPTLSPVQFRILASW